MPSRGSVAVVHPSHDDGERGPGAEAEAFEAAQQSHARYGSGALRAAVFGFSGEHCCCVFFVRAR